MGDLLEKIRPQLNEQQLDAVTTADGPLLILAGAGSGKTRVLTYRSAYLIAECGVSPFNILAVTFTNKAANEMRTRMESLVGAAVRDMQVSTFHSFAARVLRRFGDKTGLGRDFTIYDEEDAVALLKQCMVDLNINPKAHSPRKVKEYISSAKDKMIGPDAYKATAASFFNKIVAEIYPRYQQRLQDSSALDFDDLLYRTVQLLTACTDVLESLQNKYRYIMVDEYQDTNHTQYLLVSKLAARYKNICVVGDDDQSIYGWRGADIGNILKFEDDFPGCKVVRLEQNYRSTQTILRAASNVVSNNCSRKSKTLFSKGELGDKIILLSTDDDASEAGAVADSIEDLIRTEKAPRSGIAVLYRTNAQSRAIEETLKKRFIPYTIVGGIRFYQRKEIKDSLAYLKIISNPKDIISFRRIVNYPSRGLGNVALAAIEAEAASKNLSPVELALVSNGDFLRSQARTGFLQLAGVVRSLITAKRDLPPDRYVEAAINISGVRAEVMTGDAIESESRKENLDELIAAVKEYCQQNPTAAIEAFLEEITLYTDVDSWDESADVVTLMTLHSAKGLEFPAVFITGLEEGLLPHSRSLDKDRDIEEERRLFYVGITRARNHLFLTYARSRRRFASAVSNESRFLAELPAETLRFVSAQKHASYPTQNMSASLPNTAVSADRYRHLAVGRWVVHPTWGPGRIIARQGADESTMIDVMFQYVGRKKLLAKYADLEVKDY
jgi:DNA helicase-2/ATP-dependent DNA helicase PcrA